MAGGTSQAGQIFVRLDIAGRHSPTDTDHYMRGRVAKRMNSPEAPAASAATVGYGARLWQMADAPHGSMDAAEDKHVVLGLIFLKYISDAVEQQHATLVAEQAHGADPEDPDEYRALSIFRVPPEARWQHLRDQARRSTIWSRLRCCPRTGRRHEGRPPPITRRP